MSTVLTIGGSPVSLSLYNAWPTALTMRFADGYSSLQIQRRGGALPGLPDPWLGKTVVLSVGGTTYFQGDVTDASPNFEAIGWVTTYLCRDLKARVDKIPMTDSNTLTDTAGYNLNPLDPLAFPSRQGRTVGQIVTDVLTMVTNATNLSNHGVGAYTSLGPPTLPASTVADLAALTIIPPSGVYVQGEKMLAGICAFLRFWAPNHMVWLQPSDGAIRVLDKRTFSNHTLTLGTDPIDPTPLRRSLGEAFQRVVVRGQPIAERKVVSTHDGTFAEDFAWGVLTNAAAKAAWTPAQATQDLQAKSNGTCTCPSTTTVTVTSSDSSQVWASNFWDQTTSGHMGIVDLIYSAGTGINWVVSRRIVSNTALTAGGTSTLTLDLALPATNYDQYRIYGLSNGAGLVWKKYKVVDTAMGAAMARQLTYPQPWVGANGDVAVMTSFPMGSACWSNSGSPPYQEWAVGITIDPSSGHVYFLQPTYVMVGNHVPSDVRALLAVNVGNLTTTYPPDVAGVPQYAGTSHSIEGLTDTLQVMLGEWRDPINLTAMNAYAADLLDSVKDTIVEGSVVYHGYYGTALTPGAALSITGHGYTTGWEGLALPILEVTLRWNSGSLTQFTTEMSVSNRRAHFSASAFMKPDRMIGAQVISEAAAKGFGWGRHMRDPVTGQDVTVGSGAPAADMTAGGANMAGMMGAQGNVAAGMMGGIADAGMGRMGGMAGGMMGGVASTAGGMMGAEGGEAFMPRFGTPGVDQPWSRGEINREHNRAVAALMEPNKAAKGPTLQQEMRQAQHERRLAKEADTDQRREEQDRMAGDEAALQRQLSEELGGPGGPEAVEEAQNRRTADFITSVEPPARTPAPGYEDLREGGGE